MNESATQPLSPELVPNDVHAQPAEPSVTPPAEIVSADTEIFVTVPAGDEQADAMKQRMQDDVAAWTASKAESPARGIPVRAAPRPNGRVGAKTPSAVAPAKAKATPVAGAVDPAAPRKPFAMKYDGMPAARYAAERFSRGAR